MKVAIAFGAVWLGLCLCAPLQAQQPEAAEESQPRYFTRDVSFEDVDLATVQGWLARVGITIPFSIEGKLSAQTRFGVPITALGDGRKYRFHGTADSSRLVIDGLELLDVTAEVDYAEGVLALQKLQLLLPEEAGDRETAGSVAGAARMELLPRGDFTAELSLQGAPVAPVLTVFPELRGLAVARLSGKADARVPVDKFQDLAAWNVEGQLNVADFASHGFAVNSATAEAQLADGTLTVSRFRADSAGGTAEGRGRISFTGDRPFSADFEIANGDLAQLAGMLAPPGGSLDVSGNTNATLKVQGTLQPVKVEGQGRLTATKVRLDRFEVPSLEVPLTFSGATLTIDGARAEIGEGTLRATAEVALGPEAASSATVTWEDVQLEALARLLAVEQVLPRVGTVSGRSGGRLEIEAPAGALREPAKWTGRLEANVDDLAAYGVDFRRADVSLRLADGELSVERLEATEAGESLTATGRIALASPHAFTADIAWKQGRLQSLRHTLRETVEPAVRLDGRFDLATNVSGQLEPWRLQGEASLTAESLRLNDVAISSAQVRANINDGELQVPQFLVRLYDGEVQGSADVRLGVEEAGTASLTWKQVDVAELLKDALAYPAEPGSASQGEVRVEIPAGETMQLRAWHVVGSAAVDDFHVRGQTIDQARLEFELAEQLLKVGRLALDTKAGSVTGKGQIAVEEPYAFQTSLKVDRFDLALASDAVALGTGTELEIGGIVNFKADLSGKLAPLTVMGGGSAHGEQVRAGALLLDDVGFDFDFDEQVLNVAYLRSSVYEGTVQGSAQLPLTPEEAVHVDANWKDINLDSAINAFLMESPVSLSGVVGGSLSADVPAGKVQDVAAWRAKIGFQTSELESQGEAAGQLKGEATLADDVLKYSLTGTFLGGPLELEGRWPSLDEALRGFEHPDEAGNSAAGPGTSESRSGGQRGGLSWNVLLQPPRLAGEQAEYEGRLSWREVTLARLRGFLPARTLPEALDARASVELQFRHRPGGLPTGAGELTLDALAWGGSPLSERLRGRVRLGENQLQLLDFRGRYADGLAQLGARIPLSHPVDLSYEILLTRGRFRPALAPFLDLGDQLDGRLDGRLVGRFGPLWKLTGTAQLSDATLGGAEAGSWRVPLIISYDPASGRARYAFRRVRGELANGRVSGDAEITSTSRLRIEGDFRFDRLDLDPLMHSFGVTSQIGKGRISGTTSLRGSNVEDLADLSALVDARLQNTTSDAVPILGPLQGLMPQVLPSTTFEEGKLRGRLNRNVFQLQRLSLASPSAEVYATGSVSLTGRLDLEVTAGTGSLRRGQRIARILLRSLLVAAQPQLALVLRINNFLANRVIQARVTGTTTSPVIRIQPLQLLGEEALRFFLMQAAG